MSAVIQAAGLLKWNKSVDVEAEQRVIRQGQFVAARKPSQGVQNGR
jgi:hypothetical protein